MARRFDLQGAKESPSRYFKAPANVVADPSLSRADKIEILRQWEVDARLLAVAEEENLQGGESNQLSAVMNALIALDAAEAGFGKLEKNAPKSSDVVRAGHNPSKL